MNILDKYSNIKFHENRCNWSWTVPSGRTDMTKLIVAFRSFAKGPKTVHVHGVYTLTHTTIILYDVHLLAKSINETIFGCH